MIHRLIKFSNVHVGRTSLAGMFCMYELMINQNIIATAWSCEAIADWCVGLSIQKSEKEHWHITGILSKCQSFVDLIIFKCCCAWFACFGWLPESGASLVWLLPSQVLYVVFRCGVPAALECFGLFSLGHGSWPNTH